MSTESSRPAEFEGECAFAVSLGKSGVAGKDSCYAVQDGKKYVFSNPIAKFFWKLLPGRREKAESNWSAR